MQQQLPQQQLSQPLQQQLGYQQPAQLQTGYQQPVVQIVMQSPPARSADKFSASALTQMKKLSFTQVIVGVISILCGIVLLGLQSAHGYAVGSSGAAYYGYGIWIGCYYVVVGGIGIGAVRRNNDCWIIAAMVLNIISAAAFWVVLLSFASIALSLTSSNRCSTYSSSDYLYYVPCKSGSVHKTFLAMDSMLITIALIELVVPIWSAVLCCGAVCACCKPTSQRMQYNAGSAQYIPAPGMQAQPVVVYANTPGVPGALGAPGAYGSYPAQQQYAPPTYPAGTVPQPVGHMTESQAPPSYYSVSQSEAASNPVYAQPPPAYPASPVPSKQ